LNKIFFFFWILMKTFKIKIETFRLKCTFWICFKYIYIFLNSFFAFQKIKIISFLFFLKYLAVNIVFKWRFALFNLFENIIFLLKISSRWIGINLKTSSIDTIRFDLNLFESFLFGARILYLLIYEFNSSSWNSLSI